MKVAKEALWLHGADLLPAACVTSSSSCRTLIGDSALNVIDARPAGTERK